MPVYSDQPANAMEAESKGFGIYLPILTMTEDSLAKAINEILDNRKYTEAAEKWGAMLQDQITQPLDTAIWWLEFALRYPGLESWRSPVHDLHWTQYFLLDVFAFIFIVFLIVLILIAYLVRSCWRLCHCKRKTD